MWRQRQGNSIRGQLGSVPFPEDSVNINEDELGLFNNYWKELLRKLMERAFIENRERLWLMVFNGTWNEKIRKSGSETEVQSHFSCRPRPGRNQAIVAKFHLTARSEVRGDKYGLLHALWWINGRATEKGLGIKLSLRYKKKN